jgi:ATP-dependent 26S proteasome regulatory subunit
MLLQSLAQFSPDPHTWEEDVELLLLPAAFGSRVVRNALTVTLARVGGHQYLTSIEAEDVLVRSYLQGPHRRFLRKGDTVTIFAVGRFGGAEAAAFQLANTSTSGGVAASHATFDYFVVGLSVSAPNEIGAADAPVAEVPADKAWTGGTAGFCKIALEGMPAPIRSLDQRIIAEYACHMSGQHVSLVPPYRESESAATEVLRALRPALDADLPIASRRVIGKCPVLVTGPPEEGARVLAHTAIVLGLRSLILPIDTLRDTDVWRVYFGERNLRERWGVRFEEEEGIQAALCRTGPCLLIFTGLDGEQVSERGASSRGVGKDEPHSEVLEGFLKRLWATADADAYVHADDDNDDNIAVPVLVSAVVGRNFSLHGALASLFPTVLRPDLGDGASAGLEGVALRDSTTAGFGRISAQYLKDELGRATLARRLGEQWLSALGLEPLTQRGARAGVTGAAAGTVETAAAAVAATKENEEVFRLVNTALSRPLVDRGQHAAAIAPVFWEDLGGLDGARNEILDVLRLPDTHPHLFVAGSPRRRGVLLFGPPGTGKTLVAKAVATECGIGFMSIKGPELLDAYVGESERNVRSVFDEARRTSPTVIFFDELDSLAPARGSGSHGGGVMDRIVSQLLTEMDAMGVDGGSGGNSGIFVIGATNRPDLLDPALLRPGRFDTRIFLGPMEDVAGKAAVLRAQTRTMTLAPSVDLDAAAAALPGMVTGADIGSCSQAAYQSALSRKLAVLQGEVSGGNDDMWAVSSYVDALPPDQLLVEVQQQDLLVAAAAVSPALSPQDQAAYLAMKSF